MLNLLPALFLLLVNGPFGPGAEAAALGSTGSQVHQPYERGRSSVGIVARALALVSALAERRPESRGSVPAAMPVPSLEPPVIPHPGFDRAAPSRAGPAV